MGVRRQAWAHARWGGLLALCALAVVLVPNHWLLDIARWPLLTMALVALISFRVTHAAVSSLLDYWRNGWWAAAPIAPSLRTRSVIVLALAMALAAMLLVGAWLWLLAVATASVPVLKIVLPLVAGACFAAVMLATWLGLRHQSSRSGKVPMPLALREPMLSLTWLQDRVLQQILLWQRRLTVLRWRRGGSSALIGVALVTAPAGVPLHQLAGMLLLVISAAWLAVVLRACAEVVEQSRKLLAATPIMANRLGLCGWRYPWFATLCALGVAGVGAVLLTSLAAILAWWLLALALSMRSLWRLLFKEIRE